MTLLQSPPEALKRFLDSFSGILKLLPAVRKVKLSWMGVAMLVEGDAHFESMRSFFKSHKALQEVELSIARDWPRFSFFRLRRGSEVPVEVESDNDEWMWYRP